MEKRERGDEVLSMRNNCKGREEGLSMMNKCKGREEGLSMM